MNSFRICNIKSFTDSKEISLKPITILVGKNSSGKSSLLRFPAVLAQTANNPENNPPLSFFGDFIDFGNFEDVIYSKNQKGLISFSISYDIDIRAFNDRIRLMEPSDSSESFIKKVTLNVSIGRKKESVKVQEVSVLIENDLLNSLKWIESESVYKFEIVSVLKADKFVKTDTVFEFKESELEFDKFFPLYEVCFNAIVVHYLNENKANRTHVDYMFKLLRMSSGGQHLSLPKSLGANERQLYESLYELNYSSEIMNRLRRVFLAESKNQIAYIGPFRQNPARIYRYSETKKLHVGVKGENMGDVLVGESKKDSPVFRSVADWLKNIFGYDLKAESIGNNYYQIMLKDHNEIKSNIIDVGFGISQVLPIISEMYLVAFNNNKKSIYPGTNNIVLIEQPELHLHPAAQASLAHLFAMCVQQNPNTRLVIETHSEHLISKLQVLIADDTNPLTHDMVQILYVDKDTTGQAHITEMNLDENGKFDKAWPTGFFDQGFNLSLELLSKTVSKRRNEDNQSNG